MNSKISSLGYKRIFHFGLVEACQLVRRIKFNILSDLRADLKGTRISQPVLFSGAGKVSVGSSQFGYVKSPFYLSGYCYIESRYSQAKVVIGNNAIFNNNLTIIADKTEIHIGDDCLFGPNVTVFDSDFHELDPRNRNSGNHLCEKVKIGDNVFIGSNVTILKGVTIGDNSVIANGSIVSQSIPENTIAGGIPAKVIRGI